MTNVMKNEKGMTLLEVIVVLAVLGALAAMLSPVVFRYIDDANRARSQADVRTIATAIQRFYSDTGRWPMYSASTTTADVIYLSSGPSCDPTADTLHDADCSTAAAQFSSATWADSKADSLVRQLVTNGPGYATGNGLRSWKGPYTDAIPAVDAWGNPYVVNIGDAAGTQAVLVVSGGPNGVVETSADLSTTTNVTPTEDDIIARVK
jgi:general secretion pathway protein G